MCSGSQNNANPCEVVARRRWTTARGPARANVIDQNRRGQSHRIALADSVFLQELQMSLLCSLPIGNLLETVDVPLYKLGQSRISVLRLHHRRGVLKLNLAVLRPARSCRAIRKRLRFLMNDRLALSEPDDRCIASRTVRLLS